MGKAYSYAHPCALCKKEKGNHRAETLECPKGLRTRVGYTRFGPERFTPKVNWKPKHQVVI